jgi:lipoprotein-anchoring transpeptidase ErfK/SrfK
MSRIAWIVSLALAAVPVAAQQPAPGGRVQRTSQTNAAPRRDRVLALQVALDRAQRVHNGAPDMSGSPTTSYTLTADDVKGPFVKVPEDMMAKAKLPSLGYGSVEEALGEKFHCSPALLKQLNPGKSFTAGTEITVPDVAGRGAPGKAAKVVVSKGESSLTALDAQGHVLAWYPVTTGSEHDPLPIGNWKINGVQRNPPFFYNPALFWDAQSKDTKAKIAPGPNNPVGVVWIDLSKEHYGIHGTPEPSTISKTESHGCIRLTNWDASELADMVSPGTPAILQE